MVSWWKCGAAKMRNYWFLGCVVVLAGCAAKPEAIQASYVSPVTYDSFSCAQLKQEWFRVDAALGAASQQQQQARDHDTMGIVLLGIPTGSMSGEAVAPEVAKLKGQKDALNLSIITRKC